MSVPGGQGPQMNGTCRLKITREDPGLTSEAETNHAGRVTRGELRRHGNESGGGCRF